MEAYQMEGADGLLHVIRVLSKTKDELECETLHTDGAHTLRIKQTLNASVFEVLLKLGMVKRWKFTQGKRGFEGFASAVCFIVGLLVL
ncbi:MAG: hypothetical protein SNJ78_00050 [Spirochaetales bacterium]